MIRYLSTGAADLARLLAQSHSLQPSPVWAEAQLFFGFDGTEASEIVPPAQTSGLSVGIEARPS